MRGIKPVRRKLADGRTKTYYYYRANMARLPDDPQSAAFAEALARAKRRAEAMQPRDGSLEAMIAAYRASPEFTGLARLTRRDYERVFLWLGPAAGGVLAVDINAPDIIRLRDRAMAQNGFRFANYVVQVLRLTLSWGVLRGWRADNPGKGVPLLKRPRDLAPRNRAWDWAEFRTVWHAAPPDLRLMVALGGLAGMRQGDAVKVRWSAVRDGMLHWQAGKNGVMQAIPITGPLAEAIHAAPRSALTIATNTTGRPWTQNAFRARFFKFIKKLTEAEKVMPGLTYHGLRTTLASRLRDLGADTAAIRAAIGDKTANMANHYARDADRGLQISSAFAMYSAAAERNLNAKMENEPGKVENGKSPNSKPR